MRRLAAAQAMAHQRMIHLGRYHARGYRITGKEWTPFMQGERWWQAGAAQLAGRWWPAGGYKDMWVPATTDQCMKPPHTPTEQTALMTALRMPGQSPATSSQREATSSPRVRASPTLPSAAAAGAAGNTSLRQEADTSPSETATRSSTNPPGTVATQTEEPLAFTASSP